MKVLVAKCFGIGNCVMAVPLVKALMSMGHQVDVLVGSLPDDTGAIEVFSALARRYSDLGQIWVNHAPSSVTYDVAVLSIPYDGRWVNGRDFNARLVMDGRPRPDPSTFGFSSWKRHEVEYQMENAYTLGYEGDVPSTEFRGLYSPQAGETKVYFGVGYKKDQAGFWKRKHWGNENFAALARLILRRRPDIQVVMTGDPLDLQLSIAPIIRMSGSSRVKYVTGGLDSSMELLSTCHLYVGNDTGMMHVAASMGMPTVGLLMLEGTELKNPPWGPRASALSPFGTKLDVETVATALDAHGVV